MLHTVVLERNGGVRVLRASGELDAFSAPDLELAFRGLRDERRVLADLGRVSFMDSTVLGVLVRAVRELGEADADVRVVLPHGTARRIFEITALDGLLPVAADRAAGLAELEAR